MAGTFGSIRFTGLASCSSATPTVRPSEVYPNDVELDIGSEMLKPRQATAHLERYSTHLAIATPLSQAEVFAISEKAEWIARECDRGPFTLLEVWVENRLLLELLTPSSQADYRRAMTFENWQRWS